MPLSHLLQHTMGRTRRWPRPARFGGTMGLVAATFLLRESLDPVWPSGYPFLVAVLGVLLSSALFDAGAGLLATLASALIAAVWYLPPLGVIQVSEMGAVSALLFFVVLGSLVALCLGTLHHLVDRLVASELRGVAQLREYRHRSKNDLANLSALLLLRARASESPEARAGLREAAAQARALARVHTHLEVVTDGEGGPVVDLAGFVQDLVGDLARPREDGARPIHIRAAVETHPISSERAVVLGLIITELVSKALDHAFPNERAGQVLVELGRDGANLVLRVLDDGVGQSQAAPVERPNRITVGLRMMQGLAAQLGGRFQRGPSPHGGTLAEVSFPALLPPRAGR